LVHPQRFVTQLRGTIPRMDKSRRNFIKLLVEKKLIEEDKLEEVLEQYKKVGGSLKDLLIKSGYVDDKDLTILLSAYLAIPPIKILNLSIAEDVLKLIPSDIAKKYMVIPISKISNSITVALDDPLNILVLDDLERLTGCRINPVI